VVAANGASIVQNPVPERGQFSSLQIGLREVLSRGCNAAMITLVDCPPLCDTACRTGRRVRSRTGHGKWGAAPEHNGKRGHPLLANRAFIDSFLSAPVTSNAREGQARTRGND